MFKIGQFVSRKDNGARARVVKVDGEYITVWFLQSRTQLRLPAADFNAV